MTESGWKSQAGDRVEGPVDRLVTIACDARWVARREPAAAKQIELVTQNPVGRRRREARAI
jgi:hypothetical protein